MDSIFKKKPLDPRLATFSSQPNINTALPLYSMTVKNSKPSVGVVSTTPSVTPTPKVQTPAPLSAMDKVTQTLNDQTDSIKKYYEAKLLRDEQRKNQQILEAQSGIKSTEESQRAGIQDLEAQTNNLIAEEEQSMGQDQRQQARTAQDTRKRLQNQFAALGTLEGSQYGQVAYDTEQDLANKQANTRATSGRNISGYRLALGEAKRNFVSLVAKEKAALQARISEIENNFEKGSEDYNKAIRDAVFSAQNKINDANLQVETARQIEQIKNPVSTSSADSKNKVLGIVGQLKNMDLAGVTGRARFALRDRDIEAEALLKQMSAELQLEEAKRLKGQGTLTDAERQILRDAIGSFNFDEKGRSKLSEPAFKQKLAELETRFGGGTISAAPVVQNLKNAGFTDEEIQEYLNSQ